MNIRNLQDKSLYTLEQEVAQGARFVYFPWVVSLLLVTFRRSSDIFYLAPGEKASHWKYTIISLLFGWWGIPWGPIYTISALVNNFKGGKDVTAEVIFDLRQRAQPQTTNTL